MPTPLDNAMRSRNAVLAFGGLVTAVAVWAIYGGDMFPAGPDPTGKPEDWTREEMRRWLAAVFAALFSVSVIVYLHVS
ncbi:hypothetical protein COL5a_000432 [Colletotrichum fioriniae]|uniref:uncharacterized protein n=1 Tax=Colletotrichum fioriniae TaxID=710243 RepID=UPI0032DA4222|nr:hypothetical protein COL5a_000432 [Colletotrichum fioriniae]KAJ3947024.1 hypothetical protein N0V96_003409 [Colletotrichum fioriniae]